MRFLIVSAARLLTITFTHSLETVALEVEGETHEVTVKIASDVDGKLYDVIAEYDDTARVARESGVAIRGIARRVEHVVLGAQNRRIE